jgi:hypothetical protein
MGQPRAATVADGQQDSIRQPMAAMRSAAGRPARTGTFRSGGQVDHAAAEWLPPAPALLAPVALGAEAERLGGGGPELLAPVAFELDLVA